MAAPIDDLDIDDRILSFRSTMSDFSDLFHSTHSKSDFEEKINKISDWVGEQQKKKSEKTEIKGHLENVGKVLTATTNAIQNFKSGDPFKIASGTLDIISSAAVLFGGPYGEAVAALCSIIGAIFSSNKPSEPSVVEQLADVVHKEMVDFNRKLQYQKYNGLKDRISDQKHQLQNMSHEEEKLDDPRLWNDYTQFLGELSERFESPVPFKYNENLSNDADVADFVTAVVMYCQAHTCFLALLTTVRGRFEDLGGRNDEKHRLERKIKEQNQKAREKLAFLSDERYLTFLGRLPSEGGKLTKILILSRNARGKLRVEQVRGSLELSKMPSESDVECAAKTVLKQRIKLRLEKYSTPQSGSVQFINDTKFPMKIVSGLVGNRKNNFMFVHYLLPYSSYEHKPSGSFSTGGYIIIYNDGKIRSSKDPEGDVRVMEFALSSPRAGCNKVNIQDKSESERTKGLDTYNNMHTGDQKTVYWLQDGKNYLADGDYVKLLAFPRFSGSGGMAEPTYIRSFWRFVIRDFDPTKDCVGGFLSYT